jgi:glycolate oxidase iron-sulfur subunit
MTASSPGSDAGWTPGVLAPANDDIAKCVACGLCLPHCPTFRVTGRETASPRGRIAAMRAVAEGRAEPDESFAVMMDECLACRACEAACPSAVPFGRMIEAARAQIEARRPARVRGVKRLGLAVVLPRQRLVRMLARGLAVTQATGLDRLMPRRLRAATPRVSLAELRTPLPAAQGSGPIALLLTGCIMDVAFRPTHRATLRLLAASGFRAVVPERGGCCGALAMHYGHPDAARGMAKARIKSLEGADVVVVNSAGCSGHMKAYGELLADDPAWAARAHAVADKVRDLVEMDLTPPSRDLGRVAVHDACHHVHAQGIAAQPRALLRAGGAELVEIPDGTRCCGAAGLYSVTQPELSAELRRQKARAIASTGAPVVAVANPGCAMQIAEGLREIGAGVNVVHPADLLAP